MCLRRKEGENLRIAEEDITVYKLIEKGYISKIDNNGKIDKHQGYITPFMREEVSIVAGGVLHPDIPMSKERAEWLIQKGYRCFGEGFIHAYIDKDYLTTVRDSLWEVGLKPMHSLIEVECVIPKGEFYILGEKGDVAASKLIIRKVVLDEESRA